MRPDLYASRIPLIIALITMLLILAACGGSTSSGGSTAATAEPVPTMPPAQFTAVAQQNTMTDTVALTTTAALSQTTATPTAAPAADEALLARGLLSYDKNKCGDCHGAQGEGVADKGNAIAGTALTATEFDNLLRTGGGLGNEHIFGPSAISRGGMEALYAYVQSLP